MSSNTRSDQLSRTIEGLTPEGYLVTFGGLTDKARPVLAAAFNATVEENFPFKGPEPVDDEARLTRVMSALSEGTKFARLMRRAEDGQKRKGLDRGILDIVADESDGSAKPATVVKARLRDGKVCITPEGHELTDAILEAYEERRGMLSSDDIRGWARKALVESLAGTGVSTGLYFVPSTYGATLTALRSRLDAYGVSMFVYPQYTIGVSTVSDLIGRVTAGVLAEIQAGQATVAERIKATEGENAPKITERWLRARRKEQADMVAKVKLYEALFGQPLPVLQAAMDEVNVAIGQTEVLVYAVEEESEEP